ncbi:hypothetical protein OSB04_018900 [Centaurea solstitialis]|uniref:Sugar phosphate transporter domain-containing protein n=1 Tax=Centaurea solstitialis TaxID=347529 RepID=A0AA38T7Q5_9ASTR|nr:hypothetical protein OSB04_018900 [Centaurea solstitialis]
MINKSLFLTYLYLFIYILLSSGVILYNKWVLSPKYFNFPFPITLTMIHMGFSGAVSFLLVRVFKVVTPVKMTFEIYATCVVPISAFFASSLWFGNTAYLHISVAFIQMLKALMPVATLIMAVLCGTDKLRWDVFLNMLLVSVGVVISSYGEIHFNIVGTLYQVTGIFAEALRLVLTQVLLQKKGLNLNPITSLYYIAPCRYWITVLINSLSFLLLHEEKLCTSSMIFLGYSLSSSQFLADVYSNKTPVANVVKPALYFGFSSFAFLFVPWYFLEKAGMEVSQIQFNFWIFFSNAVCALALNFSIFLVIGRTGAVTIRVAGVLKDWILIALSTVIFPESAITGLNIIGYAIALCGVVMYNYIKVKDVKASQNPADSIPERMTKDWRLEKKSSNNIYATGGDNDNDDDTSIGKVSDMNVDEEVPLMASSRLSHIGRSQLSSRDA